MNEVEADFWSFVARERAALEQVKKPTLKDVVAFALEGSGTDKKVDWPYVLISAATLWTGRRFKQFRPHQGVLEIFLDSGGFTGSAGLREA